MVSLTENSELSIILCISTGPENCSEGFPEEVQKIVDNYHLSPFIARVSTPVCSSRN
jgi:tRNA-specific adenosine deaminase 3